MVTTFEKLNKIQKDLLNQAEKAIKNAYDPYSQFYVAASVLTKKGNIYSGVNINTCAYNGLCAERAAISNAVTNGEYLFEKIAIIAKCDYYQVKILSGPCGICRQMIWEFAELAKKDIEIIVADSQKDKVLITSIKKSIHTVLDQGYVGENIKDI